MVEVRKPEQLHGLELLIILGGASTPWPNSRLPQPDRYFGVFIELFTVVAY
jgi:hypothetical protein